MTRKGMDGPNNAGPMDPEFVGLEALDPPGDSDEIAEHESDDPTLDTPGDDAVLEQEELYEGISSSRLPSEKIASD